MASPESARPMAEGAGIDCKNNPDAPSMSRIGRPAGTESSLWRFLTMQAPSRYDLFDATLARYAPIC